MSAFRTDNRESYPIWLWGQSRGEGTPRTGWLYWELGNEFQMPYYLTHRFRCQCYSQFAFLKNYLTDGWLGYCKHASKLPLSSTAKALSTVFRVAGLCSCDKVLRTSSSKFCLLLGVVGCPPEPLAPVLPLACSVASTCAWILPTKDSRGGESKFASLEISSRAWLYCPE